MLRKLLTLETITEEPKDLYLVELDDSEYKGTLAQEGILGDMKDKIGDFFKKETEKDLKFKEYVVTHDEKLHEDIAYIETVIHGKKALRVDPTVIKLTKYAKYISVNNKVFSKADQLTVELDSLLKLLHLFDTDYINRYNEYLKYYANTVIKTAMTDLKEGKKLGIASIEKLYPSSFDSVLISTKKYKMSNGGSEEFKCSKNYLSDMIVIGQDASTGDYKSKALYISLDNELGSTNVTEASVIPFNPKQVAEIVAKVKESVDILESITNFNRVRASRIELASSIDKYIKNYNKLSDFSSSDVATIKMIYSGALNAISQRDCVLSLTEIVHHVLRVILSICMSSVRRME